tara:strand:- start:1069 stop:1575 length:507 start_codon:yes stop_codon:yes gene_type:complete
MTKIKKILNYGIIISSISLLYYFRNDILESLGFINDPINDTLNDIEIIDNTSEESDDILNNSNIIDTTCEEQDDTLNNNEIINKITKTEHKLKPTLGEINTKVKGPMDPKTDQNILEQTYNKHKIGLENITESDEQSTSDLEYTDANSLDNVEIIKEFEDDWDNLTKK